MAIIALKAWYIEQYEPLRELTKRPHHLRLSRSSLLKSGLRADFLDEPQIVKDSLWFGRYLEGETVEFYIEGSGGYAISNIDLISQEIYFTKQEITAILEPKIYISSPESEVVAVIRQFLEQLNKQIRTPLSLEETAIADSTQPRLSDSRLRKIRRSLMFIADGTPVSVVGDKLILNPNTCIELGYAIATKQKNQILLIHQQRPELTGKYPFELSAHQQLGYQKVDQLEEMLPKIMGTLLRQLKINYG